MVLELTDHGCYECNESAVAGVDQGRVGAQRSRIFRVAHVAHKTGVSGTWSGRLAVRTGIQRADVQLDDERPPTP